MGPTPQHTWAKKDLGAWSMPKGEYDASEDAWAAAMRGV
jgi:predicted NUDIX family NTP pyrophosphohydrolase